MLDAHARAPPLLDREAGEDDPVEGVPHGSTAFLRAAVTHGAAVVLYDDYGFTFEGSAAARGPLF